MMRIAGKYLFFHVYLEIRFSRWSEGKPCEDCQQDLFHRIQDGYYEFPEEEWGMISEEAKDLVSNLLKRDPVDRLVTVSFVNPFANRIRLTLVAQSVACAIPTQPIVGSIPSYPALSLFIDCGAWKWRRK